MITIDTNAAVIQLYWPAGTKLGCIMQIRGLAGGGWPGALTQRHLDHFLVERVWSHALILALSCSHPDRHRPISVFSSGAMYGRPNISPLATQKEGLLFYFVFCGWKSRTSQLHIIIAWRYASDRPTQTPTWLEKISSKFRQKIASEIVRLIKGA